MGEMVRQSIEKANQDLLEENQNKLAQEVGPLQKKL